MIVFLWFVWDENSVLLWHSSEDTLGLLTMKGFFSSKPIQSAAPKKKSPGKRSWKRNHFFREQFRPVKITQAAMRIEREIRHLHWPAGTKMELLQAIQHNLNRYAKFVKRVTRYYHHLQRQIKQESQRSNGRNKRLAYLEGLSRVLVHLWQVKLFQEETFVTHWMTWVQQSISHWKEGSLMQTLFDPDSKKYHGMACSLVYDFCNDPSRWFDIRKELESYEGGEV